MTSVKNIRSLRQRLAQLRASWSESEFRSLVTFYIEVLPKLMQVERCSIFLKERGGGDSLLSRYGTELEQNTIEAPLEGSIVGRVMATGESVIENDLHSKDGYHLAADKQTGYVSVNTLCIPITQTANEEILGVIQLLNTLDKKPFNDDHKKELQEIAEYLSISLESIILNEQILDIAKGFDGEVARLEFDSVLKGDFIAESPAMREVLDLVVILRDTPVNVLIHGENGTGKELVAKMIHENAGKEGRPFVPVNCACLPEALVESEFFGHEKGAFTGADKRRKGRFEEAKGGSLFLDEIGEMPLIVQPKFLRAIQEQEGTRLGSSETIPYDVRIISATNRNLAKDVEEGNFREDLFFRLFSVDIEIPPLRKRREDILPLALSFLKETNQKFKKNISGFSPELLALFEEYLWPGNVRQLLKEVERLVSLTKDDLLMQVDTCSRALRAFADSNYIGETLVRNDDYSLPDQVKALEKRLIHKAMKKTDGNKTQAAKLLYITRQGLLKKIKRYQLAL